MSVPTSPPAHFVGRLVLTALALAFAVCAWLGTLDDAGAAYVDGGIKRALLTFATARTINGLISVVQGTEVVVQPAGVGMTLTPGQILDPINDLVESFSSMMLLAATSLGVQRVLLEISRWAPVNALLGLALLLSAGTLWWPGEAHGRVVAIVRGLALLVLIVRFVTPASAVVGAGVYRLFLADRYASATVELDDSERELRDIGAPAAPPAVDRDASLLDRARAALDDVGAKLDVSDRLNAAKAAANRIADRTVDLIVIFAIETILVPLGMLWLLLTAARRLVDRMLSGAE